MFKKSIFFLLCQVWFLTIYGQGEATNWYFGNGAGIQFNNDGSVTALTDGLLNTIEGCATISDTNGDLLFYTNGINIYDRTHNIMQNGTGLYGNPSSTQAAIIVPKPEDPNIQYVFTVDTAISSEDIDRGLNYSTVDMSLNGGKGAVIEKNINLLEDCSEKIAAVIKNCFDKSIWIVTLATEDGKEGPFNTFHAFEINTSGVQKIPVKTTFAGLSIDDPRGYLKFSAEGTKLVSANSNSGLFLYDFDAITGKLSNQQPINITTPDRYAYGVEFSPNQQFLYVLASNNFPPGQASEHRASLIQYDLNATDISSSEVILDDRNLYRGALQLGENDKIYRTIASDYFIGLPYLGAINNPDEKGTAANYEHNAVFLENNNSTQGLPPFIQSFFNKEDIIKNADGTKSSSTNICINEGFILEAEFIAGAVYNWEKDGIPFINPTNRFEIINSAVADSGRYSVEILLPDPQECSILGESSVMVSPLPPSETITLTQCDLDINTNDGIASFNLNELFLDPELSYSFYESILDRNNGIQISNIAAFTNTSPFNQIIYYKVVNNTGCENFGELELVVQSINLSSAIPHIFQTCDEDGNDLILDGFFDLEEITQIINNSLDVSFYQSLEDASSETNPITGNIRTESTTIYARIENEGQCKDVEEVQLIINPRPVFDFDSSFIWCTDGASIKLKAPEGFDTYRWLKQEGATNIEIGNSEKIEISSIGNYILEIGYNYNSSTENISCTTIKEFTIEPSNIAVFEDIIVDDISENNMVQILVSGDGLYEYSMDGESYQDSNSFENIPSGFATVYVRDKNDCGITDKLISIVGYPKFFTPNNDGVNDYWQIKGVNEQFQNGSLISIYDRYGKLLAQISPNSQGWNGIYNGNTLPSSNYWFKVILEDGRMFQGPFVLKR